MTTSRKVQPRHRIYCAGPLFNRSEQVEMAEISRALEHAGFTTFLPHRDGFLFAELSGELLRGGYDVGEASRMAQQAIFWLDMYEVLEACEGLVLNLNGRVPDEGAVAEASASWLAGKPIVLYKSDSRSLIQGNDNPLVAGLGNFVKVSTIPEIAYAFAQLFRAWRPGKTLSLPQPARQDVLRGRRLARALRTGKSTADIVSAVVALTRAAAPRLRR